MAAPLDAPPDAPLVSVVIPVYNDAEGLARCLDRLAGQTYPAERLQVVVVDNGSTQDIAAVVRRHLPRATFLHEAAPGSYAARNRGLAAAAGEVVAFTDADCLPAPDWVQRGVAAITADPGLGLVAGRVEVFPRDERRPTGAELYDMSYTLRQDHYLRKNGAAATANVFTRRDVLERVGTFDASLKSSGDFEWGQRVKAAGYGQAYAADAVVRHPARHGMRPLLRKARRIAGGRLDTGQERRPPLDRARYWAYRLLPPRDVLPVAREHARRYGRGAAVRFFGAVYAVRATMALEEMRLMLGGSSVR